MTPDVQLLIHNVGYIISSVLALALALIVFVKDRKPLANKIIILSFFAAATFTISHVIAVNLIDPHLSRLVLNFNLSNIFLGLFIAHGVITYMGKAQEQKYALIFIYTVSILLSAFFLIFPDTFLLDSVPKMYFPNYYEGGSFYWLLITWNMIVAMYFLTMMVRTYGASSGVIKLRLKYFFVAYFLAYSFGIQAYLLVINVNWNPILSIFMVPSFSIIFTYAILKYDLLDIRIVAKQAFIYSILVAIFGIFIVGFNYLNNLIIKKIPDFPSWIFPLISSSVAVSIGIFVWKKMREGELLKYEFITVVTHKFRTPLTHIKWASENLSNSKLTEDDRQQVDYIQSSNSKLVELTNLLMNVSETESAMYGYKFERHSLAQATEEVIASLQSQLKVKKFNIIRNLRKDAYAICDVNRIKFVIQVLIENAIHYTPTGGDLTISTFQNGKESLISVADSGIGIPKEEIPLMFSKFYRGSKAKLTDTEGMGIGLFMSKEIMSRNQGRIWVESEGLGHGSVFFISMPVA